MGVLLNKNINFKVLATNENQSIAASLLNLEKVVDEGIHFNIPIYQRLYVWKIDQIKTLLEDLKTAFYNNKEASYFLGGIMLSSSANGKIDLVDGQQRFTSLWLICDALSKSNSSLKSFTYLKEEPRIHFSIRDKAQAYLKDQSAFNEYLNDNGTILNGLESEISEIIPLATGRKIIIDVLEEFKKDKDFNSQLFGDYIFTKVQFSQTFIPIKSDMNRVFEAMNNRGKQLAHHELLKSKLLENISSEKRQTYSLMWDSCSDMNSYIEKSLKDVASLSWKDIFSNFKFLKDNEEFIINDNKYDLDALNIVELLKYKTGDKEIEKSLLSILKDHSNNDSNILKTEIKENDYFSKKIRSIISFPTFLLHALRVYQANTQHVEFESSDVNEKKLIENFMSDTTFSEEKNVTDFITLLWRLRILFDRYVIKWVYNEENKTEYQSIENIQISKSEVTNKDGSKNETISIQRIENTDETLNDLIALQGMLYHSQEMITQYWLTPFLHFLSKQDFNGNESVLTKLEVLDNELFYSNNSDKLKDRTYRVIFKDKTQFLNNIKNTKNYLEAARGTDYPNYIFYKLEYVLWKNRKKLCVKYPKLDNNKWNQYRMTAKNSVEHIFPQNAKEENRHIEYLRSVKFEDLQSENIKPLDEFGNLVLISPGMNSEYSNKPYQEKKGKFDSKRDIDSLKSALIFKETEWDYDKAILHRNEMVDLITEYIDLNKARL
jgi:uncharacterized protein with ParB-like and HNH nuclease domain